MKLSRNAKLAVGIYLAFLTIYCATSFRRLLTHSTDIHFSYQAQMLLQRRLDLGHPPPNSNDWAEVEYLHLKDGRTVAGAFLRAIPSRFRELNGKFETISPTDIANRWKKYYVSFPPFPAVLFLPFVAIWGLGVNDVLLTVVLAALAPMLLFVVLRRLSARGDSARTEREDLILTAMFGVGTVYYYASIGGQVWYTAHIVATVLTGLFMLASMDAEWPIAAGLCLGALALTRPQIGFIGIFFLYEAWRTTHAKSVFDRAFIAKLVRVGIPVVALCTVGAAFNYARFKSFGEFGHSYLNVRWTDRIQRYGLFNFSFLSRNLTVAFCLTPKLIAKPPYLQLSWHGVSMLLTTPALAYLVWPKVSGGLHRALWFAVAPVAILSFLYQNDGWLQFGFRFSIDYLFLLMMLLAIGGRPMTRTWMALIVVGIAVNLFGAITFFRMWQFYHEGFFPIGFGEI